MMWISIGQAAYQNNLFEVAAPPALKSPAHFCSYSLRGVIITNKTSGVLLLYKLPSKGLWLDQIKLSPKSLL